MPELKLARLPDRTPVKITVSLSPGLNEALQGYAKLYQESYGSTESVAELIPFMLESFIRADRSFAKASRQKPALNKAKN
jgi:hypothetical protein